MPRTATTFLTPAAVAARVGCTPKTVRNWIKAGHIPAYVVPGERGVRLDLDEVMSALSALPRTRVKAGVFAFGSDARIIDVDSGLVRVLRAESEAR